MRVEGLMSSCEWRQQEAEEDHAGPGIPYESRNF
jgi:hypothetical protein